MARPLPRKGESHLDTMDEVMPYASFIVGRECIYWTICCCGHEFVQGDRMFWIPGVDRYVCLNCASRAFRGEDISTEFVFIKFDHMRWRQVPLWWAEERGIDWYGKYGMEAELAEEAPAPPPPPPPKPDPLAEDRLRERHAVMARTGFRKEQLAKQSLF